MKKIISVLLLSVTIFTVAFSSPALAADAANGAELFKANCASCHLGGGNIVNRAKTLKKADLEKYDMYSARLLNTYDAADELNGVDHGGLRFYINTDKVIESL